MNKYIIACALLGVIATQLTCAQSEETADRQLQDFPADRIRRADIEGLRRINVQITRSLAQAPDDSTGKQSEWYPKLQAWKAGLDQAISSGKQEDVFKMIPAMADYFTRDKSGEHPEHFLRLFETQMYDCGPYMIMAAGAYVKQHNGEVDAATLSNLVKLFSTYGFFMESDWEDQTEPIGPADLMIVNPTAVVGQLETGPWQQAQHFVGGITSPSDFFAGYGPKGDGLAVLKAKYAAQQPMIDAEFKGLVGWEARQEQAHSH